MKRQRTVPRLEMLERREVLTAAHPAAVSFLISHQDQLAQVVRTALQKAPPFVHSVRSKPQITIIPGGVNPSPFYTGHRMAAEQVAALVAESRATGGPASTTMSFQGAYGVMHGYPPTVLTVTFTPGDTSASPQSGQTPTLTIVYDSGRNSRAVGQSVTYTYSAPSFNQAHPTSVVHVNKTLGVSRV